ncbi:ankyrin repeat domain-containing protein [Candidatus Avelusimicrobium caledoniensis]|uniref:ankyrin repeat domain-containing protein n=1 Tax=Candidatus Avelusimicrobium caledoniensis TaxID=3416220 RepID=UPI003D11CD2B
MKKLNLLILVSLLCAGFAQAQDADDPELQALIKTYKAMKAQQNATPKAEDPKVRYEKALIQAARAGNASQVRGLLEAGIDPNITDEHGNTPLMMAANRGDLASVDMLLYAGADVNAKGRDGVTPLLAGLSAVGKNGGAVTFRILKEKPDVNAIYGSSANTYCTALFIAVEQDNFKVVEALIKQGADVNRYVGHATPLQKALQKKFDTDGKITELLLKAGADPWRGLVQKKTYYSPLTFAQNSGSKVKIKLIKDAQTVTKAQREKDNKLLKAVKKGKVEQVRQLLAEGANPNAYAEIHEGWESGYTALMYADNLEIAQMLLDAGADVNAVDQVGWTALMWAWKPKQLEKVKWLIAHGADVNHNLAKQTPLTLAINADYYWERVEALLNAGADVNLRDGKGYGPLFYAKLNDNKKVEEELLKRHATLTKKESEDIIEAIAEKSRQAQAAANSDGESLGKTFLKGLVDTGMSTLQYAIDNGKF